MSEPVSVYIHIPFCVSRCNYCDFVTYAGQDRWMQPYTRALIHEIEWTAAAAGHPVDVHTVFFGGGTPSHLPAAQLAEILDAVKSHFRVRDDAEISLEANPGTLDEAACRELRRQGFNRISLGMQSSDDDELRMMGRIHNYRQAVEAVQMARSAGFDNLSLDLIYGLPGQSLPDWQRVLERTLELEPQHLSLYSLTVEEGTVLHDLVHSGELPEPDPDIAADQLEWSCDFLAARGYNHYEISNWALMDQDRDLRARHNLQYWLNDPYLGFGAGAHGYFENRRYLHPTGLAEYIQSVKDAAGKPDRLAWNRRLAEQTQTERMQDEMMLGLRLLEHGITEADFLRKFGTSPAETYGRQLADLIHAGLLESTPEGGWRLTRRGLLLGNQVFMQFVGED